MTRLNLGSGPYRIEGFDNLDEATGWRFQDGLDQYESGSVGGVTISHALMYVPLVEWPTVFAEIARVLEPGGVLRVTEDSTDDPSSPRFGGHPDAVTLTTWARVMDHMERAGLTASKVAPDWTAFSDRSLIQDLHGGEPKVFFVEGVKSGKRTTEIRDAKPRTSVVVRDAKPRISVIVPTIGRDSLGRTLRSLADADEVLVEFNADGDRGYAARERAIARATGTHLAFVDDDDVFTPIAIGVMREAARQNPGRMTIFRMKYHHGAVLWNEPWLAFGNVGSPMLLVPNLPGKLGRWEPHPGGDTGGDYMFCASTAELLGEPIWREEIVCNVRPT